MKTKTRYLFIGAGSLAIAAAISAGYFAGRARAAGVPAMQALTYAGVLTDGTGTPLTGSRNFQVALFDAATAGNQVCATTPAATALVAGAFQITLPEACTAAVQASPDLWIDVFVDGASVGRSKLGAVPYALEAAHAVAATSAATIAHSDTINASDDANTGGFASQCFAAGEGGGSTTIHACSLAANRKCNKLGYSVGVFVGESDGTILSIVCIK